MAKPHASSRNASDRKKPAAGSSKPGKGKSPSPSKAPTGKQASKKLPPAPSPAQTAKKKPAAPPAGKNNAAKHLPSNKPAAKQPPAKVPARAPAISLAKPRSSRAASSSPPPATEAEIMEVLAGKLTPGTGIRATRQSLGWLSAPQKPRPAPAIAEPPPTEAIPASESLHLGEPLSQRPPELPAAAGEVQVQAALTEPETTAEPVIEETPVPAPEAAVETPSAPTACEPPAIPDKPTAAPAEEVPEAAAVANENPIQEPALPAPLTSELPDAPPLLTLAAADRDIPAAAMPEPMEPPAANAEAAAAEPAKAHPETQPCETMEQPAVAEAPGIPEEAKPEMTAFEPLASTIREWVPLAMSNAELTEKALRFAGSTLGWTLVAQTMLFVPFCYLVSQGPQNGSFERILLGGIPLAAMGIIVAGQVSSRAAQIALDHLDRERAGCQPAALQGERDTQADAQNAINARKLAYLPTLVVLGVLLVVWLCLGLTVWFPAAKN